MNGFKKNKENAEKITFVKGRFEAYRDKYQWVLTEHYKKLPTEKIPSGGMASRDSYHSTLDQVCGAVIDRMAGECRTLSEIKDLLENCLDTIVDKVSG